MSSETKLNEDFLCVPISINRILAEQRQPPIDPLKLGLELGLVVPSAKAADYPGARVSESKDQWGVHPQQTEYSIEKVLERHHIPLVYRFIHINQITSGKHLDFMASQLDARNSIIVGYDYKTVFNTGGHVGHVSVVVSIETASDLIILWDPADPEEYIAVPYFTLLAGIRKRRDGYWLFGTKDSLDSVPVGI